MIPIRLISTHRADAGHVDPLREAASKDQRFQVTDTNRGIVFVQGDRTELLGEVMSAVADNAVIAHAAGGERTLGSTDDRVRDALTKLAHLHYPVHQEARRRLLLLGEEDWRICVSGEVGVDTIMAAPDEPLPFKRGPKAGDVVVSVHPVTSSPVETRRVASLAVDIAQHYYHAWIVSPNGDPGSQEICEIFCELAKRNCTVLPDLTHRQFLTVMRRAGAIVGNSSCLITEAPHLGVFTILLGSRQAGRMPAPSDGHACQHILDHMAKNYEKARNPKA